MKAAANGDSGKIEELIQHRDADPNGVFVGHTALQAAAQNGHAEVNTILCTDFFSMFLQVTSHLFQHSSCFPEALLILLLMCS